MTPERLQVTHVFTRFRTLGGVESLLRRHRESDASLDFESRVLAWFEPKGLVEDGVTGAGFSGWTNPSSARTKFRRISTSTTQDRICVYHNCWGISFLGGEDGSLRRIGLHHSDWPGVEHVLAAQSGWIDGMLCVGAGVESQVRKALPDLPSERIAQLPLPIDRPALDTPRSGRAQDPLVIGVCGRVVRAQKRVDRLPELVQQLQSLGVAFRLEILGDGPDLDWLKSRLPPSSTIHFHGRQGGDAYSQILAGWDAILFASDYEGLPIAMLEALIRGVVPIYPVIQSGGDAYVERIDPRFLYAKGDMSAAARCVQLLASAEASRWDQWRERSKTAAAPHADGGYGRTFGNFVRTIHELPRISIARSEPRNPGSLGLRLPFAILGRLPPDHSWRRGWV